ncbi:MULTISPECIES: dUTP diphosphatase [Desulfococcus]|jgi:dUTP pyrophosphatase|uniref:Deoxyuridine 5'-triphosphate nucleotidohydrolase n=1 Tax=Desulfococcus multivorans DSM 2059 TaxID=1121405 RepID=S7TRE9_DESML|nr:dUTP diphosphatase [Desulfococcus multivorans]AQV02415.1 deoxyuridine 5'-triphosphate nucleotidohydrolase [Desulfococcus multivorans]EPR39235.1 Deoxyuridine 5'-triphosphate nucleotidohydrolase [Desulfococcus multivorans DSM 2059]MDX9817934.1 dUTP diphosphatase [Desulfococcus multivorans]SJZ58509.1 deoxyuridine 5'-triphosphate nucleotidohydrolase [Desulfococcus multivorans DSM 2059]
MTIVLQFRRVRPEQDADIPLPRYMTVGASGMDLAAAVTDPIVVKPGEIVLIPTGFAIAVPEGYEAQIRPRSGLASRHGIGLVNSPGTVDADYRGEIRIPIINLGKAPYTIQRGDRIAQMVIAPVCRPTTALVTSLDETDRDAGGFGHTGRGQDSEPPTGRMP